MGQTVKTFDDPKFQQNFWAGVQPSIDDSCWPWLRSISRGGYGQTSINQKTIKSHRVAFRLAKGYFPKVTCHSCDNPICCNPNHLIDGTHKENTRQMLERKRHWVPKGESSPHSKLTDAQVLSIRSEYAAGGTSYSKLGKKYGCCFQLIHQVVKRKIWNHI